MDIKSINNITEKHYKCSVIEMKGPVGTCKSTIAEKIQNLLSSKWYKVSVILYEDATEEYVIEKSKESDLIILYELTREDNI